MRRFTAALAALAALVLGAAPLAAHAQDKGKPAPITKDQRDKGMKDAPAVVKSLGLSCPVSDAYYLGDSTTKDGKASIYEVACGQGLGYMLINSKPPKAYDCLATREQPSLTCRLPGNANPVEQFKPIVSQAGVTCTVKDAKYLGSGATQTVYEAACQEGPGYLIQVPAAGQTGAVDAVPCAAIQDQTTHCSLTSAAEINTYLSGLAAKSGKTCQVSGNRYVGTDKNSGETFYELACGQQVGFMISTDKAGAYKSYVSCAQAQGLGGCKLTDASQVSAQQTTTYSQQAKAAGFNCDVSKFRAIGYDANRNEVVELACSNRPDGMVGVFPASGSGAAKFYDCVQAGQFGAKASCELSSSTPLYAKYTAALAAKGRTSCKVSDARYLGHTPSNTDFIETACADGKPGYVIEVGQSGQLAGSPLSCGQAKAQGVACALPTNVGH
jgi:hypothetical protein